MDFEKIKAAANEYGPQMTKFLRELVAIPGESADEEGHVRRIEREMRDLNFDKLEVDAQGNVLGYMGSGQKLIAFDAHIDTVGIGKESNWSFDPYNGFESDSEIGGRGMSDQLGGLVSAVYGARIMKDLGLIPDQYTILVTGTVQEEDCDGLCWQYIINESHIKPEFVVSTEPTDGGIYRGQRGRMEIRVDVKGISCHGSAPERGDNAIYKMADILQDIRALNENAAEATPVKGLAKMLDEKMNPEWKEAAFLGRGTVTASEIFFTSPSRCAVADSCAISLDRRMTAGETWESCLEEIRNLPAVKRYGGDVTVSMYQYDRPSWTGCVYPIECYFPTWVIPEDHAVTKALKEAHVSLYGEARVGSQETAAARIARPLVDKWTFSTNGVSIMGRNGIPCIGFGPGAESQAHAPDEITWKADLVVCAAVYAALPTFYAK
ncbi:MAG: YgeY family selenium metabolism-linked hydrolase [Peptococcaceae bacterium]|jgi:putative selenium metabolism hydrolase|nr:YgeY family selenium metabolism-linked hydrolase [Peptococcaceae bacterium]